MNCSKSAMLVTLCTCGCGMCICGIIVIICLIWMPPKPAILQVSRVKGRLYSKMILNFRLLLRWSNRSEYANSPIVLLDWLTSIDHCTAVQCNQLHNAAVNISQLRNGRVEYLVSSEWRIRPQNNRLQWGRYGGNKNTGSSSSWEYFH